MPDIYNRQAKFNYELLENFEAGVALLGWEVKSIRAGRVSLIESHARIKDGEIWLMNTHISPLQQAPNNADPIRPRKLLLNKQEINRLVGKIKEQGLALIPIKMYFKKNRVKVGLALGRGKKKYDKRATIKQRELERKERSVLRSKK
ncbi:MAG: SsrA-binding protein SmpB [Patescibacteria group bacterium]|nr:SsrA-binding protein SmpB [Patescibacteria group bacterium]